MTIANHSRSIFVKAMELDGKSKRAVQELGDAINASVEESARVEKALEELRKLGYQANFSLKLEIDLQKTDEQKELELELTEEDIKTLQKMKINL